MLKKLIRKFFPPKTAWEGKLMCIVDDNGKMFGWGMVAHRDNPPDIITLEFPLEGGRSLLRGQELRR